MQYLVRVFAAAFFAASVAGAQVRRGQPLEGESEREPIIGGVRTQASRTVKGLELGARLGIAVPAGNAARDAPLRDAISNALPLWVDFGYRATPSLSFGGYFAYAFGSNASDVCEIIDCAASTIDAGVAVQYHLSPYGKADPWLSLGTGYQWLNLSGTGAGVDLTQSLRGFEWVRADIGVDSVLRKRQLPFGGLGGFLSGSLGQYTSADCSGTGCTGSGTITRKAVHVWIRIGVRGTFLI